MKLQWPKTILMCGKGPSLDRPTMDEWRDLPEFRVCVNNSIFAVPNPTAVTYQDPELILPMRSMLPSSVLHIIGPHVPDWPGNFMRIDPVAWYCTAPNAAFLAAKMGVKKIMFLGFDSLTLNSDEFDGIAPEDFYSRKVLSLGFQHEIDNLQKREDSSWRNYKEIQMQMQDVFETTRMQYEMLNVTRFPASHKLHSPSPSQDKDGRISRFAFQPSRTTST